MRNSICFSPLAVHCRCSRSTLDLEWCCCCATEHRFHRRPAGRGPIDVAFTTRRRHVPDMMVCWDSPVAVLAIFTGPETMTREQRRRRALQRPHWERSPLALMRYRRRERDRGCGQDSSARQPGQARLAEHEAEGKRSGM